MKRCTKINTGVVLGLIALICIGVIVTHKVYTPTVKREFSEIRESGRLRVVTDKSSLGFKLYDDKIEGFNYELAKAFANSMGLELEIIPENNLDSALNGIKENKYDLLAMNIPNTAETKKELALTIPILSGRQVLVQQEIIDTTNLKAIRSHYLLTNDSICIPVRSPFRQRLENLSDELADTIRIVEMPDKSTEDLVQLVSAGKIKYTICDELQAKSLKRTFTNIDVSVPVGFTQQFSWGVNPEAGQLRDSLNVFLHDFLMSNDYWKIYRKYY